MQSKGSVLRISNKKTPEILADLAPAVPRKAPLCQIYAFAFEYNQARVILSSLCKSGHQLAKKDRMLKETCVEDQSITIMRKDQEKLSSATSKQRKQDSKKRLLEEPGSPAPAATADKVRLVVGLGNPGKEYANTRHNIGMMGLKALAKHSSVQLKNSCGGLLAEVGSMNLILF